MIQILRRAQYFTVNLISGLLTLTFFFATVAVAQTNTATNQTGTPSLSGVLDADGTIKKGVVGGFKAAGYEMKLNQNGAPRFVASGTNNKNKLTNDKSRENRSPTVTGVSCAANYDPRMYDSGSYDNSFYNFSSIEALVIDGNGNVFIGGRFSFIHNVATKNIVRYNTNTETWTALANNGLDGGFGPYTAVEALAISGNYLFVGGRFLGTGDGSVSFRNIARYDIANDVWSSLNGLGLSNVYDAEGYVSALAISGNDLFVGGQFTRTTDGAMTNLKSISRYNIINDSWSPLAGSGLSDGSPFGSGYVNAILVSGNELFVGGYFTETADGTTTNLNRIARFNLGTNTWAAFAGNGLRYGSVKALAISGNFLFVGGDFNETADGTTATNLFSIARYDLAGNTWLQTFAGGGLKDRGFLGSVEALVVLGGDLFIGGQFTGTADGTMPNLSNIARYDIGSNTFAPAAENGLNGNSVFALLVSGTDIFVGGRFTETANGSTRNIINLAIYRSGSWIRLGSNIGVGMIGMNSTINAVAVDSNGYIYVGGIFTPAYVGAVNSLNHIARYDPANGVWTALPGNGLNSTVFALTINGNDMFVGGNFTATEDGMTATNINGVARFDILNGIWMPLSRGGLNGDVTSLLVSGSELFVGGAFTQTADGLVNLNRIARYNLLVPGGNWSAFANNGLNSPVSSLAISFNYLFVGGSFSQTFDGAIPNLNRIARYNLTTSAWSPLAGDGLNAPVNALAVSASGNELFVGGFFTQTFDGTTASLNRVARYDILALNSNWEALAGNGLNDAVYSLLIYGNNLYLGGSFTTTTDLSAVVTRVAGYNTVTGTWSGPSNGTGGLGFNFIEVNNDVRALARSGSDLIIGGLFTTVANCGVARFLTRHYLKKWTPAAPIAKDLTATDWFDGSNWSDGTAPAANTNAFIPTNAGNISITSADVTMHDLLLSGGTLTIAAGRTLTINGILGLGGTINGAGTVIVTSCKPDSIINANATGYIQTTLVRCVENTGIFDFPVGTANGYSPVQLSNITGTGIFAVKANQGAYSGMATGLPANRLQRYWDLTNGGITSADVRFNYLASDVVGSESSYKLFRINGGAAQYVGGTMNVAIHSSLITGVSSFSPWTLAEIAPTAASVSIGGRVLATKGQGVSAAWVYLTNTNGEVRYAITNGFGFYRINDLPVGETYIISVQHKSYQFINSPRMLTVTEEMNELDFIAQP